MNQSTVKRWWAGLSPGKRAVAVIGVFVAVFVSISIINTIANAVESASHSASWHQGYNEGDRAANASAKASRDLGLHEVLVPNGVIGECQITLQVDYWNRSGTLHRPDSDDDYMAGCRAAWAKHGWRS